MKRIAIAAVLLVSLVGPAWAGEVRADCYYESIMTPSPFMGNGGEIFRLGDGTFWRDNSHQFLFLFEFFPTVVICPSIGLMILDDDQFDVIQIK